MKGILLFLIPSILIASTLDDINKFIEVEANYHGVNISLVNAIIAVESGFYSEAQSPKGAIGLMQLMPETAKRFGVVNPWDPIQNIAGGIRYLKFLLDKFDSNLSLVLAGYNAGENTVIRYGGVPPYPETKEYIDRVLEILNNYEFYSIYKIKNDESYNNYQHNTKIKSLSSSFNNESKNYSIPNYLSPSQTKIIFPKFDSCLKGQICKFSENDKQQLTDRRLKWKNEAILMRSKINEDRLKYIAISEE